MKTQNEIILEYLQSLDLNKTKVDIAADTYRIATQQVLKKVFDIIEYYELGHNIKEHLKEVFDEV